MNLRREAAPAKFRDAIRELEAHDVPTSKAVTAAAAELDRVEGIKPAPVTPADLAAMFSDPKATPDQIILTAAEVSTLGSRSEAWRQSWISTASAGLAAISDETAQIVEALRPAAEAHLEVLRWYAALDVTDVSLLLRDRRTEDAQKAAAAPVAFGKWEVLMSVRATVSRFDWSRCGRWSNPEHVATELEGSRLTGLDLMLAGVRAGGQIWWPTLEQATEVTARIIAAEDAAAVEYAAEQRRQFHSAV